MIEGWLCFDLCQHETSLSIGRFLLNRMLQVQKDKHQVEAQVNFSHFVFFEIS